MLLKALRPFWLATENRSVVAGERFDVDDKHLAFELADGINCEAVEQGRDRVPGVGWIPVEGERDPLQPDPAAIKAAIQSMHELPSRSGWTRGWKSRSTTRFRFFGL